MFPRQLPERLFAIVILVMTLFTGAFAVRRVTRMSAMTPDAPAQEAGIRHPGANFLP